MAVRTITTKLAVDGEAEYKKAVAACNQEIKTISSTLARVSSDFRDNANSLEALTAKQSALEKAMAAQKAKVEELQKAYDNAKAHQEAYNDAAEFAKQKAEGYRAQLEELKKSTGDTSKEQAALTAEIQKWETQQAEAEAAAKASTRAVQDWERQLNTAKIGERDLSEAVKENEKYMEEAKSSTDGCATSIDNYGNKVKDAKEGINALASALAAAGVAKTVEEIADTLMECAEAAGGFETAMAKVSTLADSSVVPLETMKAQLVALSSETGVAVGGLAEATYQALSAGVDTADAVEFVATATKLSVAGFTESATAVDVLTTAINAYGLSGKDAEAVASKLVKTQDLGKTSVGELAQNMGRVIPTAAAYNISLDNLASAYAILTKSGTNTAIATTNISAMFDELGKKGSTVSGILQEQTGKSFADLMASGASLSDVIELLAGSVNNDATAFSNLWSSSTAGKAALTILNSGAEEFTSTLDAMSNSSGSVQRNFEIMADTTEFAQQRMTNAAENLKIAIGDQLNPSLEKLYITGANAFSWATDFVTDNPWIVNAVVGLTTALGALALGVAGLAAAPTIIGALNAALALLAANPVVAVTAAVVGLGAAIGSWIVSLGNADKATGEFIDSLKDTKAAYDELSAAMKEEQKSTTATVRALEELVAIEGKSEEQKAAIRDMVEELNETVPELGLAYLENVDALTLEAEALDAVLERAARQEEYAAQTARLSELHVEAADAATRREEAEAALAEAQEAGAFNTRTLQNNVNELTKAEEELRTQIAALEEESAEYGQWLGASEAATKQMTSTVGDLVSEMEELQQAYEESYTEAYNSIDGQLGLFNELDGSAKTSIDNLIKTLSGQVDYMATYAENINKAMEMGVDQGLVQRLSDGSEESAQILAAIVAGGEEKVEELNTQLARVEEGKKAFSETVAEMETGFSEKMDDLEQRMAEAVDALNVSAEAKEAGVYSIMGYIEGAESMRTQLEAKFSDLGHAAETAYRKAQRINSPSLDFYEDGEYSIQGAELGAESERENLEKTYDSLGHTAGDKFSGALSESYKAAEEAARKTVDAQVDIFKGLDTKSGASVNSLIKTLKGQVDYMDTYAANINKAMELGVDQGLVQKLSDGSEQSSKILASIVKGGKEKVEELNAELARVEDGKKAFASTIAELETSTTAATVKMTEAVEGLVSEMDDLQKAYEKSYDSAYKSIDGQLGLLTKVSGTISTTGNVSELIFGLNDQANFLEGYNSLITQALERGVNKEIVAQLADGTEKSAQELLKIVAGSDGQIDSLNKSFERVKEGKEKFAGTIAEMETDFSSKMTALEDRLKDTVEELNASEEAAAAGASTIENYIEGAESKRQALLAKYKELALAANKAYTSAMPAQTGAITQAGAGAVSTAAASTPSTTTPKTNAATSALSLAASVVKTALGAVGAVTKAPAVTNVTINSPKALDEKTAAREFTKAQRDLSLSQK